MHGVRRGNDSQEVPAAGHGLRGGAEAERAETDPKVFTKIHFHYRIKGNGLDPKKVRSAVELSKEKYCSATIMLAKTAEISYAITIDEGIAA